MSKPEGERTALEKRHILTVSVEDYFHVGAFEGAVRRKHWERLESRLEKNLLELLELLREHSVKGTFFVLGWVAERQPELVARIAREGHEVASSGYWPRGLRGMVPDELREDLRRTKEVLESAGSNPIVGFRSPRSWLSRQDLWVLDVLAEEGYLYDSSLNPILARFASEPWRREVHRHRHSARDKEIWEFPISTASVLGLRVAISGGNYIRQLPHGLLSRAVARWDRTKDSPLVFYCMPWEFDREQPHITAISRLNKIRHYRNLAKTRWVLEEYFRKYRFQAIGDYLEVERRPLPPRPDGFAHPVEVNLDSPRTAGLQPVTIVIPLYNEADNIPYLAKTLAELCRRLSQKYRIHLNLVDDGSTDATWSELRARFDGIAGCQVLRHEKNKGVAAAIMTGIENATTDVVCSIDCDLSYDPEVLETMIPMIDGADLVTASPYHPLGQVVNVPRWRLFLSRTLSRMYSLLLGDRLHTYTSCCRVYRRSVMRSIRLEHGGFLGVAEMLIRVKLAGGKVVEFPATLESRILGESKMKIVKTIGSHLGLLRDLALQRRGQNGRGRGPSDAAGEPPCAGRSAEPVGAAGEKVS